MSRNGKTRDNPTERNMDIKNKIAEENVPELWPALPFEAWKDTCETLHMWTQIVGKVRLELSPYMNHWWQVPLYVTARGLTTSLFLIIIGSLRSILISLITTCSFSRAMALQKLCR